MFCPSRRGMGHGVNGGFTRYIVARPDQLFRLPDELPAEHGSLCEPLAACVHAICELTPLRLGDVALVSGPGPMGLLTLKLLLAEGVKTLVCGTDADCSRLNLARQMGAHAVIDVTRQDLIEHVKAETDAQLTDIITKGKGKMPAFKGKLTDDQIKAAVEHFMSLGK